MNDRRKSNMGTGACVFVHTAAICESHQVGAGTRIWAFAHILPGARIGTHCNICDHVFVENDVVIGDRTTVKPGVQLWDGVRLGNDVFVGPNVTFTNDRFPRSKCYPERFLRTVVEDGASIGANATVLPGLRIGREAMVGAGAVVTKNVPSHALVVGNPAVIVRYLVEPGQPGEQAVSRRELGKVERLRLEVGGCQLWRLSNFVEVRGSLTPIEFDTDLPFTPRRCFFISDVPKHLVRGEHAHHNCRQFMVAARGSVTVALDDGLRRQQVKLDSPLVGLYVPPMVWATQCQFESDSVLLVMASEPYDAADYVRDYEDFRTLVNGSSGTIEREVFNTLAASNNRDTENNEGEPNDSSGRNPFVRNEN